MRDAAAFAATFAEAAVTHGGIDIMVNNAAMTPGTALWDITVAEWDDVMAVNADPETFSSQKGGILTAYGPPETRHPLLFSASVNAIPAAPAPTTR